MWGECVFVDPIADVAVLGTPDNQGFDKEAEAYDAVVKATFPLPIGDLPLTSSPITLPSSFTETTRAGKEWITAPPVRYWGPWRLARARQRLAEYRQTIEHEPAPEPETEDQPRSQPPHRTRPGSR